MVPSTYEAGTLYNVLPSGNRAPDSTDQNSGYDQTRADFTFDRGSNAAATRVNSDGLIEKYRENLFLNSNQFDTGWPTSSATFTSGQSGYDGSSDAWLLTSSVAGGRIQLTRSDTGVHTTSAYFKKGSADGVWLRVDMGTDANIYVNLIDGTKINSNGEIATKITDVENGWYRVELTANWASVSNVRIYPADTTGAAVAGNIYIQDAQLEQGLVATDYLDSGATTAKAGVLIDLPRINYDANGENGSLLLEPSRQQLLQYSEFFNTYYTIQAISTTANAVVSPEGLQNASKLIPNSGTGGNRSLGKSFAGLSGIHTFSTFAKAGEYGYVSLRLRNSPSAFVMFDLNDGSIHNINTNAQYVTNSAKIEDYGNGWYRCSVSFDPSGSDTAGELYPSLSVGITGDETTSFDGDGTSGIYIYGMQFEQGSYATSYIPNHSGTGGVTRAADAMSADGTGLTSTTKGSIFVDFNRGVTSATTRDASNDGLYFRSDNFPGTDSFEIATDTDGSVRFAKRVNSSFFGFYTDNSSDRYKCVFKWNAGAVKFYVNVTQEYTSASGFSITNVLDEIGYAPDFRKSVTQIALFSEEITDAEAITLTTL